MTDYETQLDRIENLLMGRTTTEAHADTMRSIKALDAQVDDLKSTNAALLKIVRNALDGKLPPCLRLKP